MSAMPRPRTAAEPRLSTSSPLRLVQGNAAPADRTDTRSVAPPPLHAADEEREICAISRSTVQAAIEVLAGTRPAQQLARRLDERCLAALQHRAALTRRVAVRGVAHRRTAAPQSFRPLGPGLPGIRGCL